MVDEFNEFLFDYTSKISIKDIKDAQKKGVKKEEDRIASPYTMSVSNKKGVTPIVIYSVTAIILVVIGYVVFTLMKDEKPEEDKPIEAAYIKLEVLWIYQISLQ